MDSQFVHLHLHTQYSLLDGANKIPEVLEEAHRLGQPAIAITDHGTMHGVLEFYEAAKKIGIKALIGCEFYVNPLSRHERKTRAQGGAPTHHLTVLAKNNDGYRSLCRLTSLAYREGFYFKPRIDHELLEQYGEGLIVLSGCLTGEVSHFARMDDERGCRNLIEYYARLFKDDYYLEIQPQPSPEQQKLNSACMLFAKELGIPLAATNDCHYLRKDDHFAQEVLMCISTGKLITDPDRIRHDDAQLHLRSAQEMRDAFGGTPEALEAIANTVAIAEKCSLKFDFSTHYMPKFEQAAGKTLIEQMSEKARDGLAERLAVMERKNNGPVDRAAYEARLEEEIGLIDSMGFAGYFLVVADFINWAKNNGVPVGPGRGSAAGSLVAYAMRITAIDPIANKLLFERFLNPERVSLPDIDVDFCIFGRDRVIQYVVQKYGKEKVAQIATFGTMKAKAVIKDVGRVLGVPYAETDRIAQLVPAPRQGFDYPLAEAIKMEKKLAEYAEGEGRQLIELALKLEGLTRHSSTHAAGVVIGDRPLDDMLPMMVDKDNNDVTQFSMKYVEKIGLVKFDFLGLKTLSVLHTALRIIKESRGVELDLEELPVEDVKTYELLCDGETTGIFQLESSGITDMTTRLKPNRFDDLVAILALYRPGPLDAGMVEHYIARKHGKERVTYLHPMMESILDDTYGIILYQEQIMQLARELAGYSLGEADLLRRAMGKKVPEEMAKQRDRFVSGAVARGVNERSATEIFDQMETFARYGFNRSHSAAYAMIAFQTAYLKAHYGVEFMAALLTHEMEDSDKTLKNLTECRKQKIEVLPPDVNCSLADFSVSEGRIRYGLTAVKGVGEKAVAAIIAARDEGGPFKDLEDLVTRIDLHDVNRRVIENMIKCGAFDCCGLTRRELFERVEEVIRAGQALQRDLDTNQMGLFSDTAAPRVIPRRSSNRSEWPVNQKLAYEREALGFYISGHPLEKHKRVLATMGVATTEELKTKGSQSNVRVGGVVTALRLKNTKKGNRYATFTLEDWLGTIETIVWPDVYAESGHLLVNDDPIVVTGKSEVGEGRCSLVVEKIESLIAVRDRTATQGVLMFGDDDELDGRISELAGLLKKHGGKCPLKVRLTLDGQEISLWLRDENDTPVCVLPSEDLCDEVEQLFGRPILSFV